MSSALRPPVAPDERNKRLLQKKEHVIRRKEAKKGLFDRKAQLRTLLERENASYDREMAQ